MIKRRNTEEQESEVEEIMDSKLFGKKKDYDTK
jgi:hypothetical protein